MYFITIPIYPLPLGTPEICSVLFVCKYLKISLSFYLPLSLSHTHIFWRICFLFIYNYIINKWTVIKPLRRYMAGWLPIPRKTLSNKSNNPLFLCSTELSSLKGYQHWDRLILYILLDCQSWRLFWLQKRRHRNDKICYSLFYFFLI